MFDVVYKNVGLARSRIGCHSDATTGNQDEFGKTKLLPEV